MYGLGNKSPSFCLLSAKCGICGWVKEAKFNIKQPFEANIHVYYGGIGQLSFGGRGRYVRIMDFGFHIT